MEMKMNWDKLRCMFLLQATEFRRVGADMKHEDTQRRRAYSVFNAFNANNAWWSITNLLSMYANSYTLCVLCFGDRASLYNLFPMKAIRCTLLLRIFISTSLHVSDNYVPIISTAYCIYATLVFFILQTRQPPIQSKKYHCHIDTVSCPRHVPKLK